MQTVVYPNAQPAATIWYHDHAIGITRLNVYAGLAGYYQIRDGNDTGWIVSRHGQTVSGCRRTSQSRRLPAPQVGWRRRAVTSRATRSAAVVRGL